MPILLLAAAVSFACLNPSHHDGDAIRCAGDSNAMRLFGIDAPEMPGACRPGRDCTPGDPYAARDHLAALTRGRMVRCTEEDIDNYGRRVVSCSADGTDISCAMVADGYAVERYGRLDCPIPALQAAKPAPQAAVDTGASTAKKRPAPTLNLPGDAAARTVDRVRNATPLTWVALWIIMINAIAYAAFVVDKQRSITALRRSVRRIPETTLLTLAALGGSAGAIAAQQRHDHKTSKQPFASLLLGIVGLQIGAIFGVLILKF
ncbi:MAG: DUF1294 domain-containing protein [Polymorphobacter sp.]